MAWRSWVVLGTALGCLAAVGCGPARLNQEVTFSVGDVPSQVWVLDSQSVDQTIKLDINSDGPVDVFVLVGTDQGAASAMTNDELKAKAVASRTDAKQDSVTAKIPAKQVPVVVVRFNAKREKASGKLKLTN
jgi:hypothetical protein